LFRKPGVPRTVIVNDLNITVPDTVEATAHNGNITVTGTVSYGYQRIAAEATVAALVTG
jgi:hypothetical protein